MDTRNTKIVATVGPASNDEATLKNMFLAGVDVVRMNFSHGDHETHGKRLSLVRSSAKKAKKRVAILQDLSGPKIRIGEFASGSITLRRGETFTLTTENILGDDRRVYINYPLLPKEISSGSEIMIFDGKIKLRVQKVKGSEIVCTVIEGGEISNKKGVNVPGANLSIKSLTTKDKKDLLFGIKEKVDFIAFSFVRSGDDVRELRELLKKGKSDAAIISKIETREAVDNIDEILELSDAVMIARGDLAVEIGAENVPMVQKSIIKKANRLGKPVITATQMLDSMEHAPVPTRAEVSDIANAIFDGTDAVMLSGETASGQFPLEAVQTMARVAEAVEHSRHKRQIVPLEDSEDTVDAVTLSAVRVAETVKAKAIIALTESGLTARMISRFRAPYQIYAVSPSERSCNKLVLTYGVTPIKFSVSKNVDTFIKEMSSFVIKERIAKKGDKIVLSAGMPFGKVGSTNTLFALTV
jgi:pyruvate kinase